MTCGMRRLDISSTRTRCPVELEVAGVESFQGGRRRSPRREDCRSMEAASCKVLD